MVIQWSDFRNREALLNHGPPGLRADALDILAHAIHESSPYANVLNLVSRQGDRFIVGDSTYDLGRGKQVFMIGAGKATQPIALALEELLGDDLTDGIVVLKQGEPHYLNRTRIIEASHPIPNQDSVAGAFEAVKIAKRAGDGDLVLAAFTGGSSALMVYPADDIQLADKQRLNKVLLECGASIREINAVRKHVSMIKGGRLGQMIFPAALVNLTVSDVIGDPLDYITDLTVPDTSTYRDAWATLDKYRLWEVLPASVCRRLQRGAEIETPKSYAFPYQSSIVVPSDRACRAAAARCSRLGYATQVLTNEMEGESCLAAVDFIKSALSMAARFTPPGRMAFLASGETTVQLNQHYGEGGRNQEFALSSAFEIAGLKNVVVAALAPDGTDGPTDACGGLVDGETTARAAALNLSPEDALLTHSSNRLLTATGDLMISGPTSTNVNDVALLLMET